MNDETLSRKSCVSGYSRPCSRCGSYFIVLLLPAHKGSLGAVPGPVLLDPFWPYLSSGAFWTPSASTCAISFRMCSASALWSSSGTVT